jgi:diaminopimelate epimerase
MNATVPFVKMNGTRNEFVVVDGRETPLDDPVAFAQHICDPTRGPGADGLLLALDSATADVRMRIINADGSEPEMCGNGIRCLARYPEGTNVHFAQIAGDRLRVLHWERGAGATAACGTGAVSCAAVAIAQHGFVSPVNLDVPGGTLTVEWSAGERATLIGDAVVEFSSTFG